MTSNGKGPWDEDNNDSQPDSIWTKPRKKKSTPDDFLDDLSGFAKTIFGGGGSGPSFGSKKPKALLILIPVGLIALWAMKGLYRVEEGQLAVVQRFGEMVRITSPGLQFYIPPIETVTLVQAASINRIDGGTKQDNRTESSADSEQSLVLTGDENMVHTNYTVLWKIKDVSEFLFIARDPLSTIKAAAESTLREIIGQTQARLVLTEGRDAIAAKAQDLLQRIMDEYKIGVQIISFQLKKVEAPAQVIQAFNDVQASLIDADRTKNEAEAYTNDILPRARGEAEQILQQAEAYKAQIVTIAEGEAIRYKAAFAAYSQNPQIAQKRAYFETMETLLTKVNKIVIDPKLHSITPYLPLNELNKAKK
ncbi:MAG TPA: FtsH protease activity modulator HflK [Alphaproteobacteria bacterium]|nr:FtsH protease activity modulator HflK [Alphaproteobacteria bacterium]